MHQNSDYLFMSYGNGALSKNSSAKKADCSLDDLFDYLSAKGAEVPYAYAQILITIDDYQCGLGCFDTIEVIDWEGIASISWHTFLNAGVLPGHEYLITGMVLKIRQRQPCSESIKCFV